MSEEHTNVPVISAKEKPLTISLVGPYMFVSGVVSRLRPGNDIDSQRNPVFLTVPSPFACPMTFENIFCRLVGVVPFSPVGAFNITS